MSERILPPKPANWTPPQPAQRIPPGPSFLDVMMVLLYLSAAFAVLCYVAEAVEILRGNQ